MADPKPDVLPPMAQAPAVRPDLRLTPELHAALLALVTRLNDHEARIAALEP